jgi:hypothetical protein
MYLTNELHHLDFQRQLGPGPLYFVRGHARMPAREGSREYSGKVVVIMVQGSW